MPRGRRDEHTAGRRLETDPGLNLPAPLARVRVFPCRPSQVETACVGATRWSTSVVIVGSYDDVSERNAWLVADTAGVAPERQMRGLDGTLSYAAFYNRVKAWSKGPPAVVEGGVLRDGAYVIRGLDAAEGLMVASNGTTYIPPVGAPLVAVAPGSGRHDVLHCYNSCSQCGRQVCSPGCEPNCCQHVKDANQSFFLGGAVSENGCAVVPPTSSLVCSNAQIFGAQNGTALRFWLTHTGNSTYRMFALNTGLVLTGQREGPAGGTVTQEWPKPDTPSQLWHLEGEGDGFAVRTLDGGLSWGLFSGCIILAADGAVWTFEPVLTM